MNNYEAMLLVRPDLTDQESKTTFEQVANAITSKGGKVETADIWANKRKLAFKIRATLTSGGARKYDEAIYYLVNFKVDPLAIDKLKNDFKLHDAIIRSLIIAKDKKK